ncbi:unnamed protein product [Calypogeia fissa]
MAIKKKSKLSEFDKAWPILQKGITKVINLLDGLPEKQFTAKEYTVLMSTVMMTCIQPCFGDQNALCLYDKYKESLKVYNNKMVLPVLRAKHDEFLLQEFGRGWENHKVMVTFLSTMFGYLDRYFLPRFGQPSLRSLGPRTFHDLVYEEMKNKLEDILVTMIHNEREGGKIDWTLVKNMVGMFVEIGVHSVDFYEHEIELPMLTDAAAYYSRKAALWIEDHSFPNYMLKVDECLQRENERARNYMHVGSVSKLLEKVQHELLVCYEDKLLENKQCCALLRDNKFEDLSQMYKLFCNIPNGLQAIAAFVQQQVADEGTDLIKQGENTPNDTKVLVMNLIKLDEKYMKYLTDCFLNNSLIHKVLKEGFEKFCNKMGAGVSSAEVLATFCDILLREEGKSRQMSDDTIEETLEKVIKFISYIYDKDLFAEFHRNKLAHRLLYHKNSNDYQEQRFLTKLKQEFGGHLTSKMETMITDMTLAKEKQASFANYLNKIPASNPGNDLSVTVLNTASWPDYKSTNLRLPREMVKSVEVFNDFYQRNHTKRKLTWNYSLGTSVIETTFGTKPYELVMTPHQAAVVLLFNEGTTLSFAYIKEQLNLANEDIARLLHSLSCAKYKILSKDGSTKTVSPSDEFTINTEFSAKMKRVKMSLPTVEEKKKVTQEVDKDRRYAIEASIIRIMKSLKVLPYQQLLNNCIGQLEAKFKPDLKVMKRIVEDLISREFLERDTQDATIFRYVA